MNLTKFGFFHAFERKQDVKAITSIYLKGSTTWMKDKRNSMYSFEIVLPNASWSSLKKKSKR